jgi:hypothetical protein
MFVYIQTFSESKTPQDVLALAALYAEQTSGYKREYFITSQFVQSIYFLTLFVLLMTMRLILHKIILFVPLSSNLIVRCIHQDSEVVRSFSKFTTMTGRPSNSQVHNKCSKTSVDERKRKFRVGCGPFGM